MREPLNEAQVRRIAREEAQEALREEATRACNAIAEVNRQTVQILKEQGRDGEIERLIC